MTKNYFAPHKIVAKIFRAPSKIVKNFSYPTHIRSARVPGIKNGQSLKTPEKNLPFLQLRFQTCNFISYFTYPPYAPLYTIIFTLVLLPSSRLLLSWNIIVKPPERDFEPALAGVRPPEWI